VSAKTWRDPAGPGRSIAGKSTQKEVSVVKIKSHIKAGSEQQTGGDG